MKNIINGKRCVGECRKMQGNRKYEHKNIPCEIFYVVSVLMSGEILKGQKFGRYRTDRNQGRLFFNFQKEEDDKGDEVLCNYDCDQKSGNSY